MKTNSEKDLQPRLDPFVFPSETTLRFALLIVSVISVSLFVYNLLYWSYRGTQIDLEPLTHLANACMSQSETGLSTILKSDDIYAIGIKGTGDAVKTTEALKDSLAKCAEPYAKESLNAAWFAIRGVGILVSLASLLYSLFPVLMIRQEGLISLERQADMEDVVVYLRDLCQEIGIRPPKFLQNPTSRAIGGRAFGALGRYYVVLPTGLLIMFDQNRDTFRAIMLHELSHLRNKDIDKIYFSLAIVCAFVIVALIPFAFSLLEQSGSTLFQESWRFIALTLLVYLTFASVVRSRELYADVRASTYAGSEALTSIFQTAPKSKFSGWRSIVIATLERLPYFKHNRWQFAFLFHPDASQRCQILETTDRLFYLDIWAAFSTGIVVMAAYDDFHIVGGSIFSRQPLAIYLISGLVVASLIVGILGIGVWRRTYVALIRNQHSAETGKLGLALGLGMIVGQRFSLINVAVSSEENFTLNPFWVALLLVSLYYFFKWMSLGALIWLRVAVYAPSPHLFFSVGLIVAGFCLTLWLRFVFASRMVFAQLEGLSGLIPVLSSLFTDFVEPLALIALASLWAFPLSACFWHKRQLDSTFVPRWGFLDQIPDQIHHLTQKQLEVYPALRAGLMGGLIYCGLLFVLRLGLHAFLPEPVRNSEMFKLSLFGVGYLGLAVLLQIGIAMKVARKIQSFNKVHGLFAAFIGGCVMAISALVLNLLFGGTIDPKFAWTVFSLIVNCGALFSLLGMMIMRLPKNRATISDSDVAFES